MIQLDKINVDNPYLRFGTDLDQLKKSIEAVGLIAPLVVNEEDVLLAGGRRYQALKELGMEEAPINRVKCSKLEQELMSIDENLVRKDLNNMEFEANLRRAKEIYEELVSEEEVSAWKEEEENIQDASQKFVLDISEKTGLPVRQIQMAINRDELADPSVKTARGLGELSVSQTNEIIKLKKEEQEEILPVLKDKTVSEIKEIVKVAKKEGVEAAKEKASHQDPNAREMKQMIQSLRKLRSLSGKLILENIIFEGKVARDIREEKALLDEAFSRLLSSEERPSELEH